ncbi:hypothetical protein EDS67_17565 [candidate division KSB1 bacterium]|nr:MAG: hypothetical protein EDS67_17565 [candidate division KSB1 bacterium]MBC6946446.1 hypothetical protein [candidate division KSB1 bacterium]MCE7942367.1 hypothetical protein [Chlorobi bacterium CHB1]MDL1878596.1 hypothetical protein [Cytophagia bacterium CHB2]
MKTSSAKRQIEKTRAFSKDIKKLSREVATAGWKTVLRYIYAPQLNLRKLEGYDDVWRLVVKKDYRLVYSFDGNNIYLLRFAHRKDIYRLDIPLK